MKAHSNAVSPPLPSNRKFGSLFTVIFALLAWYANKNLSTLWAYSALGVAAVFGALTAFAPSLLTFLNRAWFQFGLLLGKFISPLVLGVIFFVLLTPIAVLTRAFGRDVLRLKRSNQATYWVERTPVGPAPESFKNQF